MLREIGEVEEEENTGSAATLEDCALHITCTGLPTDTISYGTFNKETNKRQAAKLTVHVFWGKDREGGKPKEKSD